MNKNYRSFTMGHVVATPAALELLEETGSDYMLLLRRHMHGDWGNLGSEDKAANDNATKLGGRVFSSYNVTDTQKIWVITEADRSSTCVMTPADY